MKWFFQELTALYTWLWQHTTGRPWTFVVRDWGQKHPMALEFWAITGFLINVALLALAAWRLPLWSMPIVAIIEGFIGIIVGHIFFEADTPPA